jgi:hypothetical protein
MNLTLSLEIQAIIHLGASVFSTEKRVNTQVFLSENKLDWEKIYELACFHQIRPLILRGVLQFPNCSIPQTILLKLKHDAQQLAFHGLHQTNELRRLLNLYKENDIVAIPYKGVWLAHTYYGDFGMREFSDIDLFIYEKDITALKKIMFAEGYQPYFKMTEGQEKMMKYILCEYNFFLFDTYGQRLFHIEPHYKSNGLPDGIKHLTLLDLAHRLKETTFANTPIKRFSAEDELILAVLHHGMKEGWASFKYIFDVYAILKKEENALDWDYILNQAKNLKITNTLSVGLFLVHHLFAFSFPNVILKAFQETKIRALALNRFRNLDNMDTKKAAIKLFIFNLKCLESWYDRLKIIFYRLFLPNGQDILFISLSPRWAFLYFFIRPIRGLLNIKIESRGQ